MVLKGKLLERADRNRGRFRSLMLAALQHFLLDAHDKRKARKRGGNLKFVAWDEWMAEAPSQLSVPMAAIKEWPAETVFDVRWAATMAERALRQLREECESHGRRRVFDALSGALTAEREDISYAALARELGVEESGIKRLLHQMRLRYRQLLRAEVAATIDDPAEVDDELRYLCSALVASTSS
jgi:RNA polymerase sigma-70 factor (ECF subfamily)